MIGSASPRSVSRTLHARAVTEGAGVHLRRAIGNEDPALLDPFLLLDDFHSDNPAHYLAGFPWHPHRGIETVSYLLEGSVEHGDSMGNNGVIGPGDVQWMTAGSGIVHQEMPKGDVQNRLWGFQLWVNLPRIHKMMEPRYQEVKSAQIPVLKGEDGTVIRVIAGAARGVAGPVRDIMADPLYLDVSLPAGTSFLQEVSRGHTVFAYVVAGEGTFGSAHTPGHTGDVMIFSDGNETGAQADRPCRFLLIAGKPLNEPIAWHGPIVMNTEEELAVAFEEYGKGTFIKSGKGGGELQGWSTVVI